MKLSTILLAGSLAANAALIALFVAGSSHETGPAAANHADPHPAPNSAAGASAADAAVDPAMWAKLQTDDLPGMLERLRAEGFPPAIVRAIMAEQVRVQFAPRRAVLNLKEKERSFWEPQTHDAKTDALLSQIMKEQNKALKDLLGPDLNADDAYAANLRRQLPNLSDDKIAALQRLQQDLNEKRSALFANATSIDGSQLAALDKAQHAEIAKVLTPQELEDYDLRTSNTANTLRRQLATFDPTEQEFRTLYQLQRPFDEQYQLSLVGGMLTDQQRQLLTQRADAQRQLTEQIKAALGDQRYADYQRSIDYNYQQTSKLVARLELPPETTNQVYAVQQDLQQRMRTVQMDRTLALADRNVQLAALAAEAQTKVTSVLGPRGYEAYKQYGGSWLQQLQPRPIPPPRPPTGTGGGGG